MLVIVPDRAARLAGRGRGEVVHPNRRADESNQVVSRSSREEVSKCAVTLAPYPFGPWF